MKRANVILFALLVGCVPPEEEENQGIAVGNPGVVSMSLAECDEFTVTFAEAPLQALGWASCDSTDRLDELYATLDLATGPEALDFPAGDWCGVVVRLDGPLELELDWDDGTSQGSLVASITLPELTLGAVDGPLAVDDTTAWALELASPDWLDPAALGLADGLDLTITAEDDEHELLVAAFTDETALFDDLDASGLVETPERDEGAVALPMQIAFNPDPYGGSADAAGYSTACSCEQDAAGSSTWAIALLLSLGLVRTRRRRR